MDGGWCMSVLLSDTVHIFERLLTNVPNIELEAILNKRFDIESLCRHNFTDGFIP